VVPSSSRTAFERTVLPWDLTPLQALAGRRVIASRCSP
jgi:hypothetical protein